MQPPPSEDRPRRRPTWRAKFGVAARGLRLGIKGHTSFFAHFFATALVGTAAAVLGCEAWQWCALIGCVGAVLTAELINSAVETLFRGLDPATKERCWPALDVAAGAVLMASLSAAAVGLVVFASRLWG